MHFIVARSQLHFKCSIYLRCYKCLLYIKLENVSAVSLPKKRRIVSNLYRSVYLKDIIGKISGKSNIEYTMRVWVISRR